MTPLHAHFMVFNGSGEPGPHEAIFGMKRAFLAGKMNKRIAILLCPYYRGLALLVG